MEKVLDFIHTSLDLLPQPASLYDSSGNLIGRNKAAEAYRLKHDLDQLLSSREIVNALDDEGPTSRRYADGFALFLSKIEPFPRSPRPTLVLATWHSGVSHQTALFDHSRVLLMVRVNEAYEGMVLMLEAAQLQIQGVIEGQREAVAAVNDHTRMVLDDNYRNSPE